MLIKSHEALHRVFQKFYCCHVTFSQSCGWLIVAESFQSFCAKYADVRVEHLRWFIRDLATTRSIETDISVIELQAHECVIVGKRGQKEMVIKFGG